MGKNDYKSWKAGEKVQKAPWVIEYWKNITDENQYRHSKKCESRNIILFSILYFILGFLLGYFIFGW